MCRLASMTWTWILFIMSDLRFFYAEQAKQYRGVIGTYLSCNEIKVACNKTVLFNIEDAETPGETGNLHI